MMRPARRYWYTSRPVAALPTRLGIFFRRPIWSCTGCCPGRGPGYIQRREGFVFRLARQKLWRYYTLKDRLRRLLPLGGAADRYGGEPLNSDELLEGLPDQFQLEEESVDRLLARQVLDALRSRPTEVQKIFYLHFCMDLTLAQIARELGLSESGVKNKLYRTLAALRREYGLCSAEPPDGERTAG